MFSFPRVLAAKRCDAMRCLNQKGLLLKMCLGSTCSSASPSDDFSRCANHPCETRVEQRRQFRGCSTKECLQFLSDSPLDISQDEEETVLSSAREVGSSRLPGKSDLSQERKTTCISTCLDIAARLGTSVGACVNRLCSLNASTDNTVGISKRWGSRVCMENHCASVETDLNAYVACGMEFCG